MNASAEIPGSFSRAFDTADSLIYGIGNVGRLDDGLAWAVLDWLEDNGHCPASEYRRHYQLHLEDADLISRKRQVLFVDATKDKSVERYSLTRVEPRLDFSFTSHAISVPSVMATCQTCFTRTPDVYLLAIRGYAWDLEEGLTARARENLEAAKAALLETGCAQTASATVL